MFVKLCGLLRRAFRGLPPLAFVLPLLHPMLKIMLFVILAVVAARGLYLLNGAVCVLSLAGSSAGWPKVEGLVVRTEDIRQDLVFSSKAMVRYSASDGREDSTELVSFGDTLNPFDRATAGVQRLRYPGGSKVEVSYDPGAPQIAVLRPGWHADMFWPLGVSLAFLLPVALCLLQLPALTRGLRGSGGPHEAVRNLVERARREGVSELDVAREDAIPMSGFGSVGAIVAASLASLACAGGILLLASGLPKAYYGFASQGWPTASGEVIVNVGLQVMSDRQNLHNTVIFPPGLVYRYDVEGTSYVNSVRRFRSVKKGYSTEQAQEAAPEDLPVGKKVMVAYMPGDPEISALEPGIGGDIFIVPAIGAFLLLLSFSVFIWGVPRLS